MHARLSRLFATRIDTKADQDRLDFEPGQVWQIGRGPHSGVELLVVKTETDPELGKLVHVSIRGPLFTSSGFQLEGIPHLPFLDSALQISPIFLVGYISGPVPDDWCEMYEDWVKDASEGEAGLFSLTVGEILNEIMARLPV